MPAVLRHFPDASLTIAGFGPEEAALRTQTRALGLEGSVRYVGAVLQAELPTLYRRASLLVAPFVRARSEEHTSELQSLMRISYAVLCLKKKKLKMIQITYTGKNKIHNKHSE